MKGLIAECGNHHLGYMPMAKELIRTAKECGANWVKMQAIDTDEFKGGSMPRSFYRQCDLGMEGYLECAAYGDELGIPVFFSVFGTKYGILRRSTNKPYKISGGQFHAFPKEELAYWNEQDCPVVCSVPNIPEDIIQDRKSYVTRMHLMYVTEYNPREVDFDAIERFGVIFDRELGYSDHSIGISNCRTAIEQYGCRLIEKHFNLWGKQEFEGVLYRDSLHAANPSQLERLASCLNSEL